MTTENRKRVSNVLLAMSLCLVGAMWLYGLQIANEAHDHPEPVPLPSQMQYDLPDIVQFRS